MCHILPKPPCCNISPTARSCRKTVTAVSGVHRVMVELVTATEKAGKAIAEGQAQLQKGVEKVLIQLYTYVAYG